MEDKFKAYGYQITTDPQFQNKRLGISPELAKQLGLIGIECKNKNTQLIIQYPTVPVQKTLLSPEEEDLIINSFNQHEAKEDFTVVVSYNQIKEKNYSLSAGQYFDVKIEYNDITTAEFESKMTTFKTNLNTLFAESKKLEAEIQKQLGGLKYE